ncbi:contact-dependent growth inhibition system immunity protein [Brucella sp. HL-2]|nr:contact-dependent growth inhibition system immunity protein [Brucella sp. HL-2]MCV9910495.1 contact-dependent growth inhibition system immunity protein [Brucella sp. HL-2]
MENSLKQFFGAYFYQGWKDDYGSYEDAVSSFGKGGNLSQVDDVIKYLEKIIEAGDVDKFDIANYGANYNLKADHIDGVTFLKKIVKILRKKRVQRVYSRESEAEAINFFQTYFSQDSNNSYNGLEDVLDNFGKRATLKQLDFVIDYARSMCDSVNVEQFEIKGVGGIYSPSSQGLSNREFFSILIDRLSDARNLKK